MLLGLFTVMFSIAWSNGSFGDVLLILLYVLYVLPASVAMVMIGTWAISSANQKGDVRPSTQSQRKLGILLLLPAPAAIILLIWGYPAYRFWLYSSTLGALLSLLALAMFAAGIYCLKQAGSRGIVEAPRG